MLREHAGDDIRLAADGKRHDDLDQAAGIGLRKRAAGGDHDDAQHHEYDALQDCDCRHDSASPREPRTVRRVRTFAAAVDHVVDRRNPAAAVVT
jgi:hypothetical protein